MKIKKFFDHYVKEFKEGEEWIQDLVDDIEDEYPNLRIHYNNMQKYWKSTIYMKFTNFSQEEKKTILNKVFSGISIIEENSNMKMFDIFGSRLSPRDSVYIENMGIGGQDYESNLNTLSELVIVIIEFIPKNSTGKKLRYDQGRD
jgi:hypothetical protein